MGLKVFTTPSVPLTRGQKNSGERGCNCPTVLNFLPLRLSCKENSTFSSSPSSMVFTPPSVPPFPGDRNLRKRGCNRPPVLFFRKSPRPSLPLKRAPPLTPTLSPSGEREETAPPRRSEPLRYKVGGASKPSPWLCGLGPPGCCGERSNAASKSSPCCAGWDRLAKGG